MCRSSRQVLRDDRRPISAQLSISESGMVRQAVTAVASGATTIKPTIRPVNDGLSWGTVDSFVISSFAVEICSPYLRLRRRVGSAAGFGG